MSEMDMERLNEHPDDDPDGQFRSEIVLPEPPDPDNR